MFGRLTQRLECHPHTVEVTGSNPVAPTSGPEAVPTASGPSRWFEAGQRDRAIDCTATAVENGRDFQLFQVFLLLEHDAEANVGYGIRAIDTVDLLKLLDSWRLRRKVALAHDVNPTRRLHSGQR